MNIAFSISTEDELNGNENFMLETFQRIAQAHLEHRFIFITNKIFKPDFFSENVITEIIVYETRKPLQWLIWQNIKIPKILKKHKADILLSGKISARFIKIPQILIAPDLSFIHQPSFLKKKERFFFKKFTPGFLKKASSVIVFSLFEKEDILRHYKIDSRKIEVIYNGIDENIQPVTFEDRETIKEKYAGGNEFFIYSGIISPQKNIKNLLKAFSAFKKRQRSNMQLIIAGKPGRNYKEFEESLALYKFKKEVRLLENLPSEEILKISASAWAMVYPSIYENSVNSLMEAMKSGVPVITSSRGAMQEIFGEAALYFEPENSKDIAEKMMLIYKDENLRKDLVEKGFRREKEFNWEKSAFAVWNLIQKTFQ